MEKTFSRRTVTASAALAAGLALLGPRSIDGSLAASASRTGAVSDPVEVAISQSRLEVTGNIFALYQQMHPDSQDEVPLYAVQYWYDNEFLPTGPRVIEPTGVTFVDWTWEVTGTTYPDTAEISFAQSFADGSTVEDVVRLVEENGKWRWFFGRSREFVDEQIELAGAEVFPDEPSAPPAWARGIVDLGTEALATLPEEYPGEQDATLRNAAGDGGTRARTYSTSEGYTVAAIDVRLLGPDQSPADAIRAALFSASQVPAFRVLAWDLTEGAEPAFATFTSSAGEVNANGATTVVASRETGNVWTVSAPDEDAIETLGKLLAGQAIPVSRLAPLTAVGSRVQVSAIEQLSK